MDKPKVGSLFSGIGGFDKGLEDAGFEIVWQIESDPFCIKVLEKHWPGVKRYGDIKKIKGRELESVDLICGGPPCQPASIAGKRKGTEDNRWLWPEALRVVRELRPNWCLFENPTGILSLQGGLPFEHVLLALEGEGYEVSTVIIPACAVGAPHRRDRVWIIAHAINNTNRARKRQIREENCFQGENRSPLGTGMLTGTIINAPNPSIYRNGRYSGVQESRQIQQPGNGIEQRITSHPDRFNGDYGRPNSSEVPQLQEAKVSRRDSSHADQPGLQIGEMFGRNISEKLSPIVRNPWEENWYEALSRICGIYDELPGGMDRHRTKRLKALGNAVVPQIVEILGNAIMEGEEE